VQHSQRATHAELIIEAKGLRNIITICFDVISSF
jgi:hypothetical protein